jgi:hypothetical protein
MTDVVVVETIDVGRVDEGDPRIQRGMDHPDALLVGRSVLKG